MWLPKVSICVIVSDARKTNEYFYYFLILLEYKNLLTYFSSYLLCFCCIYDYCHAWSSCLTLYDPMAYSPLGFSVCGIFQERLLDWFAISYSRRSSWAWIKLTSPVSPASAGRFFTIELWFYIYLNSTIYCTYFLDSIFSYIFTLSDDFNIFSSISAFLTEYILLIWTTFQSFGQQYPQCLFFYNVFILPAFWIVFSLRIDWSFSFCSLKYI